MRKRIYNILAVSKKTGDVSWWFDAFIISLILLNVVAMILESVKAMRLQFESFFYWFELFSIIVFTIEYILRIMDFHLSPKI